MKSEKTNFFRASAEDFKKIPGEAGVWGMPAALTQGTQSSQRGAKVFRQD